MSKVVILPIVSGVAYLLKQLTGVEIGEELQNSIVDFGMLGFVVVTSFITSVRTRKKKK